MAEKESESIKEAILSEGLLTSLKPSIEELDASIVSLRQSQVDLQTSIESLSDDIKSFSNFDQDFHLEVCLKKLTNSRRRVMLVNNILQNSQERLNRIQNGVAKELVKKKNALTPPNDRQTNN